MDSEHIEQIGFATRKTVTRLSRRMDGGCRDCDYRKSSRWEPNNNATASTPILRNECPHSIHFDPTTNTLCFRVGLGYATDCFLVRSTSIHQHNLSRTIIPTILSTKTELRTSTHSAQNSCCRVFP